MKVYIGKYPNTWWSTRRWAEDIHARRHGKDWGWEVKEEEYDWVDRLIERVADAWQSVLNVTINQIAKRRTRKIKIRIDPSDTWGMDHTLGMIILPMLKQLKATKHGSQWVDDEDVPHLVKKKTKKSSDSVRRNVRALDMGEEEDQHADVHVRWEWVLDEMIWAFEQVNAEDDGRSNYYVPYEEGEEVERVRWKDSETGEWHDMLTEEEARKIGKFDHDLQKKYQARISNGLKLFGKYYQGLWD